MFEIYRKLGAILSPQQLRMAVALLLLMFIGMALETLGVGLVVPILLAITDMEAMRSYPIISDILARFGDVTQLQVIVGAMLALVAVYVLKVTFLAFLAWWQANFLFGLGVELSSKLFRGYLHQPYVFHLQRNSAELIRNVTVEISELTTAMTAACLLIAEILVAVGISILLLTAEPVGALLVLLTLGISAGVFYAFSRRRVVRWGSGRQVHEELRLKWLHQGLGGVKEVKITGSEDEFAREYHHHITEMFANAKKMLVLQAMPRLWLELMAVLGLVVLVISMLLQGKNMQSLVPTLGLFAAAAFRVMPSVNRFLGAMQTLRYNLPVVNVLYKERDYFQDLPDVRIYERIGFTQNLLVQNLSFTHEGAAQKTLDQLNFSIKKGQIVGFIGESGAGKSTLIDLLLGILETKDGGIYVDGQDIRSQLRPWQNQIGYVPQSIYLVDASIRHNVAFGVPEDDIDEVAVVQALKAAQLDDFVQEQPEGMHTIVGERGVRLSGGQRQRIGIARALYNNPEILILDEATSALDTTTESEVMKAVFALRGEKTVLIVAHRLSTVENCDWLYKMERGQIVASGISKDVLAHRATVTVGV